MVEVRQTAGYARWFKKLRDQQARARIDVRIRRLSLGNPGDARAVGEGVLDSLIVLIVTGMVQLTASSNYVGFLNFSNTWAKAIFLKHIAVGGMIAGHVHEPGASAGHQSNGDVVVFGQSQAGRHGRPDSPPVATDADQHGVGDCGAAALRRLRGRSRDDPVARL